MISPPEAAGCDAGVAAGAEAVGGAGAGALPVAGAGAGLGEDAVLLPAGEQAIARRKATKRLSVKPMRTLKYLAVIVFPT